MMTDDISFTPFFFYCMNTLYEHINMIIILCYIERERMKKFCNEARRFDKSHFSLYPNIRYSIPR